MQVSTWVLEWPFRTSALVSKDGDENIPLDSEQLVAGVRSYQSGGYTGLFDLGCGVYGYNDQGTSITGVLDREQSHPLDVDSSSRVETLEAAIYQLQEQMKQVSERIAGLTQLIFERPSSPTPVAGTPVSGRGRPRKTSAWCSVLSSTTSANQMFFLGHCMVKVLASRGVDVDCQASFLFKDKTDARDARPLVYPLRIVRPLTACIVVDDDDSAKVEKKAGPGSFWFTAPLMRNPRTSEAKQVPCKKLRAVKPRA